jgi:hypothetical protein
MLLFFLLQIQLLAPLSDLYTNLIPVQWAILGGGGSPLSLSLVWKYQSGYFSPPDTTLTIASSQLLSTNSFSFLPTQLFSYPSLFQSTAPTLPDGDWLVFAQYAPPDNSSNLVLSAAVSLSISCTTLPAQIFQPLSYAYYQDSDSVRVNYFLPSVPSTYQALVTTVYNASLSMDIYNTVNGRSVDFWLFLDADNSQIDWGPSVQRLTTPFALSNGSYNLTVSYADSAGHPVTTCAPVEFFVGSPPAPDRPSFAMVPVNCTNQTVYVPQIVTETIYVDRIVEKNVTVWLTPNQTCAVAVAATPCNVQDYVLAGRSGTTLFWVCALLVFFAGVMVTSAFFVLFIGLCDKGGNNSSSSSSSSTTTNSTPAKPPVSTKSTPVHTPVPAPPPAPVRNAFAHVIPSSNEIGSHMAFASEQITSVRSRSRGKNKSRQQETFTACIVDSQTPV